MLFAKGTVNRILTALKVSKHVRFLITYFVEHFNVSRSEISASSEKPTVTSWISWRKGVRTVAITIRSWVAQSVVRYVDLMAQTKSGSVAGAVIHCVLITLILSQFDRIISIFVVKREQESFTGISRTAIRTWKEHESLTILSRYIQKPYGVKDSLGQNIYSNKKKYLTRGSDLFANRLICVTRD